MSAFSFPRQQTSRVEVQLSDSVVVCSSSSSSSSPSIFHSQQQSHHHHHHHVSPLGVNGHLELLETSSFMDEVSHQRQLTLLPEGGMAGPSTAPNSYYGLRRLTDEGLMRATASTSVTAGIGGAAVTEPFASGPPPSSSPSSSSNPILQAVYGTYILGGGTVEEVVEEEVVSAAGGDGRDIHDGVSNSAGGIVTTTTAANGPLQRRIDWHAAIPTGLRPLAVTNAISKLDASSSSASSLPQQQANVNSHNNNNSMNATNNNNSNNNGAPLDDAALVSLVDGHAELRIHLEDGLLRRHFLGGWGGGGGGSDNGSSLSFSSASVRNLLTAAALHYVTFVTPLISGGTSTTTAEGVEGASSSSSSRPWSPSTVSDGANVAAFLKRHLETLYGDGGRGVMGGSCGVRVHELDASMGAAASSLSLSTSLFSSQQLEGLFGGAADNSLVKAFVLNVYDVIHAHLLNEMMSISEDDDENTKPHRSSPSLSVFVITGLGALSASADGSLSSVEFFNGLTSLCWGLASLMHHMKAYRTASSATAATTNHHHHDAATPMFPPFSSSSLAAEDAAAIAASCGGVASAAQQRFESLLDALHSHGRDWGVRFVFVLPPSSSLLLSGGGVSSSLIVGDRLSHHVSSRLRLSSTAVSVGVRDIEAALAGKGTDAPTNVITTSSAATTNGNAATAAALYVQQDAFNVPLALVVPNTADQPTSTTTPSSLSSRPCVPPHWAEAAISSAAERIVDLHNNFLSDALAVASSAMDASAGTDAAEDDDAIAYVNGTDDAAEENSKEENISDDKNDAIASLFSGRLKRKQPVVIVVTPSAKASRKVARAVSNCYTSTPVHMTALADLCAYLEHGAAEEEQRRAMSTTTTTAQSATVSSDFVRMPREVFLLNILRRKNTVMGDTSVDQHDDDNLDLEADDDDNMGGNPPTATSTLAPVTFITIPHAVAIASRVVTHDDDASSSSFIHDSEGLVPPHLFGLFTSLFEFAGDVLHVGLSAVGGVVDCDADENGEGKEGIRFDSSSRTRLLTIEGNAMVEYASLRAALLVFGGGAKEGGCAHLLPSSSTTATDSSSSCAIAFARPEMEQLSIDTPAETMATMNVAEVTALVVRVLVPQWEVRSEKGDVIVSGGGGEEEEEVATGGDHRIKLLLGSLLHKACPLTYLESLLLATSEDSSASPSPASHHHQQQQQQRDRALAALLLAWGRRLRPTESDTALLVSTSNAFKQRLRDENNQRAMALVRLRRQQQQKERALLKGGGLDEDNKSSAGQQQSAARSQNNRSGSNDQHHHLIDFCAPFSGSDQTNAAMGTVLLCDALLDILLLENPMGLMLHRRNQGVVSSSSSSSSSSSVAVKGWAGAALHLLIQGGLVTPIRCVQNPLKALPPYLKAMERQQRMLASGFGRLQEALRQHHLRQKQQQQQQGGVGGSGSGGGGLGVVSGITNTAWAGSGAFSSASSSTSSSVFAPSRIVVTSYAVVFTPLGRRVSSLLLPRPMLMRAREGEEEVTNHQSQPSPSPSLLPPSSPSVPLPFSITAAKYLVLGHAMGLSIVSLIRGAAAMMSRGNGVEGFSFNLLTRQKRREALANAADHLRALLFVPFTGAMLGESLVGMTSSSSSPSSSDARRHPMAMLVKAMAEWPQRSAAGRDDAAAVWADDDAVLGDDDANGSPFIASPFCERSKVFDPKVIEDALANMNGSSGGGGGGGRSSSTSVDALGASSVRLPSRGWLTEAAPIVVPPENNNSRDATTTTRTAADGSVIVGAISAEEEDALIDDDDTLTPAEKVLRKEQRRLAREAKAAIQKQLATASVQFGKARKLHKKRRTEGDGSTTNNTTAAAEGGGGGIEGLRVPSRMTPLGPSIEIDPALPNSEYLAPAAERGPYPSMLRELCTMATKDPFSALLMTTSSHYTANGFNASSLPLCESTTMSVVASDLLIVLRLAVRNAVANLCITLESPQCIRHMKKKKKRSQTKSATSTTANTCAYASPLLEVLEPTLRATCDTATTTAAAALRNLTARLTEVSAAVQQHTASAAAYIAIMGGEDGGEAMDGGFLLNTLHARRNAGVTIFDQNTTASAVLASLLLLPQSQCAAAHSNEKHNNTLLRLLTVPSIVDSSLRYTYSLPPPLKPSLAVDRSKVSSLTLGVVTALCSSCFALPAELSSLPATDAALAASLSLAGGDTVVGSGGGGGYVELYEARLAKQTRMAARLAAGGGAAATANGGDADGDDDAAAMLEMSIFSRLMAGLVMESSSSSSSSPSSLLAAAEGSGGNKDGNNAAPPTRLINTDAKGQWLDSAMSSSTSSSSSSSSLLDRLLASHTLYGRMPSYSGRCAHTAFRSKASIEDIVTARKMSEKKEADRRQQAAREAAARLGVASGGDASGMAVGAAAEGVSSSSSSSSAMPQVSEMEDKIIKNGVKLAKMRGRQFFEKSMRGKPMFSFIEEGDRLYPYYVSLLLLEGVK